MKYITNHIQIPWLTANQRFYGAMGGIPRNLTTSHNLLTASELEGGAGHLGLCYGIKMICFNP